MHDSWAHAEVRAASSIRSTVIAKLTGQTEGLKGWLRNGWLGWLRRDWWVGGLRMDGWVGGFAKVDNIFG